jgi:DNA-binding CsgD family transcriptional regulator
LQRRRDRVTLAAKSVWEAVIAAPVATFVARQDERFVGRENELAVLRAALDHALAGRGCSVMIAGEPGIGKTRTARELAEHAGRQGAAVLWGRCHEEAGAPSYWPWVQIIRGALAVCDHRALLGDLGAGAGDIADIVPEIRERLAGPAAPARPSDPAEARFRMFEAVRQLLARACADRALVLVLDDLHWADAPSLRLLEFLAPEVAESRLLLVGTYRATELSRQHPLSDTLGSLARVPHVARVNLPGLSAEEVQAFVAAAAGTAPPHWFARTLHRQTEGNPLFLREIVRFLEQQGVLNAGLEAPEAVLPPVIRIPEGVKEVIGRRLNFLSATCNEVLALAAVIGRDFSHDVLLRAAPRRAAEVLFEALDEALAAHIIDETGAGHYQFTHNLIRETLYDELRPAQRIHLHRAVGDALEALHEADLDAVLPELARHFRAAGEPERGLEYAVRAGERADRLLAFEDAAGAFQVALDALEQRAPVDEAMRCRLLYRLGEAQRKSGDVLQARVTLHEAAGAARQLGLADVLAQAALAYERVSWRTERLADAPPEIPLAEALRLVPESEVKLRVELSGALARALLYAGAEPQARDALERAIAMARQLADPALLATTLDRMFDFPSGPDGTHDLLALSTEAVRAAEASGIPEMAFLARSRRVVCCLELGDIEAVEEEVAHLLREQASIRQPDYFVSLSGLRATLALMRGDLGAAERLIAAANARAARSGFAQLTYYLSVLIFTLRREQGRLQELGPVLAQFMQSRAAAATWEPGLAVLYVELGRLAEARALFERLAARDFDDLPRDGRWTMCLAYLVEVCAALGDAGRAAALYRLLLPYADRTLVLGGGVVFCGAAARYLGLLSATMARWAAAERHFEKALAINAAIGARLPLAHTRHDYAAMLVARGAPGDRQRAVELLRTSLESARELGMRALEERAAARLQELVETPSAPAASDELTPREIEVLRLIAIGRSNADIATALAISPNTVATHVRSILAKTGSANRTEAAAYAMRHNLAPQPRA